MSWFAHAATTDRDGVDDTAMDAIAGHAALTHLDVHGTAATDARAPRVAAALNSQLRSLFWSMETEQAAVRAAALCPGLWELGSLDAVESGALLAIAGSFRVVWKLCIRDCTLENDKVVELVARLCPALVELGSFNMDYYHGLMYGSMHASQH